MVKVHELLARQGVVVPQRSLHRYADEVCDVGRGRRGVTVRVADSKPGGEFEAGWAGWATPRRAASATATR